MESTEYDSDVENSNEESFLTAARSRYPVILAQYSASERSRRYVELLADERTRANERAVLREQRRSTAARGGLGNDRGGGSSRVADCHSGIHNVVALTPGCGMSASAALYAAAGGSARDQRGGTSKRLASQMMTAAGNASDNHDSGSQISKRRRMTMNGRGSRRSGTENCLGVPDGEISQSLSVASSDGRGIVSAEFDAVRRAVAQHAAAEEGVRTRRANRHAESETIAARATAVESDIPGTRVSCRQM